MAERLFNRGEEIFHQGDHGETFYRIIDGTVGIYVNYSEGEEHKLTELTKGQYVGEMAVIDSYPRSATAVALEDGTKLQEVSENELNNFFSESVKLVKLTPPRRQSPPCRARKNPRYRSGCWKCKPSPQGTRPA